jgi:hypothetical protein
LLPALLSGCGSPSAAVVAGTPVTQQELEGEVARVESSLRLSPVKLSAAAKASLRRDVLDRLVEGRLYSALAARLGLTVPPHEAEPARTRKAMVLAALLGPPPSDREARAVV